MDIQLLKEMLDKELPVGFIVAKEIPNVVQKYMVPSQVAFDALESLKNRRLIHAFAEAVQISGKSTQEYLEYMFVESVDRWTQKLNHIYYAISV